MVARAIIASASCVLASIAEAHFSATSERSGPPADSIPLSSEYVLFLSGKKCGEHSKDALVDSWGECQSKCDDFGDNCQYFSVYSQYLTGKHKNKFPCQLHKTCDQATDSSDRFLAVFQKKKLTYETYTFHQLKSQRILRHHNIMRCMHDAPPLQWSAPLEHEAGLRAMSAWPNAPHIQPETKWNPMPGGFDALEQRVSYQQQPQVDPRLMAYWDKDTCGPARGDDPHDASSTPYPSDMNKWNEEQWCASAQVGNDPDKWQVRCKPEVSVHTDVCPSGLAECDSCWQGNGHPEGPPGHESWSYEDANHCKYAYFAQYKCKASPALTRPWWDFTLAIDEWYNNDELQGPLLWPSTAYVGCGAYTDTRSGIRGAGDVVCNYGPEKSPASKHLDKTVRPRNKKKTAQDCAFSIDSQSRFEAALIPDKPDTAKRVTIAYTPKARTGLSQQLGDCGEISEYRLVFDGEQVHLVGVDPETMNKPDTHPKPCKDSGFTEFHTWGYDTDAYFTDVKGTKQCLKVTTPFPLADLTIKGELAVDSGETSCGRHNYFGLDDKVIDINGAWHFTQDYFPKLMCMMDVKEGAGVKSVLDNLPAGNPDDETNRAVCSGQWTVRAFGDDFNPPVPPPPELNFLEASQDTDHSCSVCRSRVGNFACALTDTKQCALAPTEFDCKQRNGRWCGPRDWKVQGDCAPKSYQCEGAVDPHHADQAGCVQLGGVYKTHFNDCALIADGVYTENDCQNGLKNNNGYEDRDVSDCVNLVKQTHDKTANVFDFVAGYKYDVPQHAPYCRLWHCSGLKDNTLPKQDGDQAWLIAYKTKNTLSQNFASIMV